MSAYDSYEWGIVANVVSDRILRTGAKVRIDYCHGMAERPRVHGLSKGGRYICKYTHYKRLENFRAAWIPLHMCDRVCFKWETKPEAADNADALEEKWQGLRFFHRDGTMLRDGISQGEADKRWMERRLARAVGVAQ